MNRHVPLHRLSISPLFKMAVIGGVKDAVTHLLRQGAEVNAVDEKGRPALIFAAEKGHLDICRILLEADADPEICDDDGNDALSSAIAHGWKDIEDVLRVYLPPQTPERRQNPPVIVSLDVRESGCEVGEGSSTVSILDEGAEGSSLDCNELDLSLWEEEVEPTIPDEDASCLLEAAQVQKRISRHIPIDMDEDWSNVDIELPSVLILRRGTASEEDMIWQTAARHLICDGLDGGRVTAQQLLRAVPTDPDKIDTPDDNYLMALEVVLQDLRIQVEEASDVIGCLPLEPDDYRKQAENGAFDNWTASTIDEALVFLSDLLSYTSDPLRQYYRDIGPSKVLSREEEVALAQEIFEGCRETLRAVARSPAAMVELVEQLESVERGDAPIQSIIGNLSNSYSSEEFADEDENGDEVAINDFYLDALDIVSDAEIPVEVVLKFDAIRTLHDAMVGVKSTFEREVFADRLAEEIQGLELSSDFLELLWSKIRLDGSSHQAIEILDRGLGRAQAAKNLFVNFNLRLVLWIARKYRGLDLMDLIQEGNIGLLKAIDRFDPSYGAKFSTYATWWIRQSITRAINDKKRLIRFPVYMVESAKKLERAKDSLSVQLGKIPTIEQLAQEVGLPMKRVREILRAPQDPISITAFPGIECSIDERIEGSFALNPEEVVVLASLKETLAEAMECLSARELQVLRLRFGLDDHNDHTLEEVGQMYGVTRERIRQIEAKALGKLAHPGRSKKLRTFMETFGGARDGD
ncbi:sigma-70 family RNA polymerase sigma factor [Thalassospira marina]|nr:sigma-70 family RNA polymerase sigma factor [Thalassospira marina]